MNFSWGFRRVGRCFGPVCGAHPRPGRQRQRAELHAGHVLGNDNGIGQKRFSGLQPQFLIAAGDIGQRWRFRRQRPALLRDHRRTGVAAVRHRLEHGRCAHPGAAGSRKVVARRVHRRREG